MGASFFRLTKKGGIIMGLYSLDKNSLQVGRVQSWADTGETKPVILIKGWTGSIPKVGERINLELLDGREISTSPAVRILLGGQTYIETRSTIYLDKETWEKMYA
jgi:hypothetical protein